MTEAVGRNWLGKASKFLFGI